VESRDALREGNGIQEISYWQVFSCGVFGKASDRCPRALARIVHYERSFLFRPSWPGVSRKTPGQTTTAASMTHR